MEYLEQGSVLTPAGFRAGSAACGIKDTPGELDVTVLVSDAPAAAAGVFTTNRFAAAPVQWCRDRLPTDAARALVVNAGNANACTGEQGRRDVQTAARCVAGLLDCAVEGVLVASTGIIGRPLPMERLGKGVHAACAALEHTTDAARAAERAIMTTDTRPKACAARGQIDGRPFAVGGMAKGSGMIAPNMATMLCFVTTDAAVEQELLQEVLAAEADRTFNRITVDGDTSTNDTLIALAGGAAGVAVPAEGRGVREFRQTLRHVLAELSAMIVADAEGATRVLQVTVTGAASPSDADLVSRAVAESQLVKCALYGGDPNWGRIVCAVGYSDAEVEPAATNVHIGQICVLRSGAPTGADAHGPMQASRVEVQIDLGLGKHQAQMLTCDLSEEYVRFNSAYHT